MKTILSRLLVVMLVASTVLSSAHAAMSFKLSEEKQKMVRKVRCAFGYDSCRSEEKGQARKWLLGVSVATIAAAAAIAGLAVTVDQIKKKRAELAYMPFQEDQDSAGSAEAKQLKEKKIANPPVIDKRTRYAQCLFRPDKANCSEEDNEKAKKWLLGVHDNQVGEVASFASLGGIYLESAEVLTKKWHLKNPDARAD